MRISDWSSDVCSSDLSEGILRFPNAQYDMVRLGIGLYGVARGETSAALQTVGTLKTTISQIRELPAGETVGYGRAGKLTRPSSIATVQIGSADRLDRRLRNGKRVQKGKRRQAPVMGAEYT